MQPPFARPFVLAFVAAALVACGSTDDASSILDGLGDTGDEDSGATDDTGGTDDVGSFDAADTATDGGTDAIGDAGEDTVEACRTLGCACDEDSACDSGYCIDGVEPGARICSELCEGECSDPDYVCALLENGGGDVVRICVPDTERQCRPCEVGRDCGSTDGVCLDLVDGSYCTIPCLDGSLCPSGSTCESVDVDGTSRDVCVPDSGVCSDCYDPDGDGYGIGAGCFGADCDETSDTTYEGADELCNEIDDDCDGEVDETFDLASDVDHCGACEFACDFPNSVPICDGGLCGVGACIDGWGDCNDLPVDGCETDLTAPDSCGTCAELGGAPGSACGTCGEGAWACNEDGTVDCVDDPGEERLNECGGCGPLAADPGDRCGACGSGVVVCDGANSTRCDGDLGDEARNECGGCDALDGTPGDACGTCDGGLLVCASPNRVACSGDPGDAGLNACGGCSTLPASPGTRCGTCDSGRWVCDGAEGLRCEGDLGDGARNGCGGCGALGAAPGDACGTCGSGTQVCDGIEALQCAGDEGDDARNGCGGCDPLDGAPGETCGVCGEGAWLCLGPESVTCDGEIALNACGGCAELEAEPDTPCGGCGLDAWVCDGTEAVACTGDTRVNDCGGCTELEVEPGTACGPCGTDEYACMGAEVTMCVEDSNCPPSQPEVAIDPAAPTVVDRLTCEIVVPSVDPNGDDVTYVIAWFIGDLAAPADLVDADDTVPASSLAVGQTWSCVAVPTDGELSGTPGRGGPVTIGNPCEDGVRSGVETDVDCGGDILDVDPAPIACDRCDEGQMCALDRDCDVGLICDGGVCAEPPCPDGTSPCGAACVDLLADEANCGSCGNVCPGGTTCGGGECRGNITFAYTGGAQTFVVPEGVRSISIQAWGAQGGSATRCSGGPITTGGRGGFSAGTLATTPGETLHIYVGGTRAGTNGGQSGGFNGGGAGGQYGGPGGGASDVRQGGSGLANRVIVAGGGGGANGGCPDHGNGGAGGGTNGNSGTNNYSRTNAGGGTQASGGSAGDRGGTGTLGNGWGSTGYHFAGGGGGYYGGGGGYAVGGGGGSGYVGGVTGGTTRNNERSGNGQVVITF